MNDEILIEGLTFDAIVGIRPAERLSAQPLILDVRIETNLRTAAHSGEINDTVSYSDLARQLQGFIVAEQFELLETLAERCAALVLEIPRVRAVEFAARKPQALANAEAVGVRIYRAR